MRKFSERLAELKAEALEDFEDEARYQGVRVDVIELLRAAKSDLPKAEYAAFKLDVMSVLHDICGTHLDLQALERYCPEVLSHDDIERIIQNSALARWM